MARRAEAEFERLHYFRLVTEGSHRLEEPLLQLEYFRRPQLDVQRAYYATRGLDHRSAAERFMARSSAGMAVGAIASGVAGLLAAAVSPARAALAGVGLAGQAFGSAAENQEATPQDRRNAERYRRTRDSLDHLYAKLDTVREAVAEGNLDAMEAYAETVDEHLSLEHREWIQEIGEASHATARLEAMLRRQIRAAGRGEGAQGPSN